MLFMLIHQIFGYGCPKIIPVKLCQNQPSGLGIRTRGWLKNLWITKDEVQHRTDDGHHDITKTLC
jgi:hypothetical protein